MFINEDVRTQSTCEESHLLLQCEQQPVCKSDVYEFLADIELPRESTCCVAAAAAADAIYCHCQVIYFVMLSSVCVSIAV